MYGADGSEGVPEDDVKAVRLYMKAANMGDAYAMNHLGYVYSHGKGVPKNMGKAVFWWKKAAAAGGEPGKAAQTWLDVLHQKNPPPGRDLISSTQCLQVSVATG